MFEQAATSLSSLGEGDLKGVANLVRRQLDLEHEIESLDYLAKAKKEELRKVSEDLLPAALEEHGLRELRMADGSIVTVTPFYGANIPKDRTQDAFNWLRSNSFGDLIKNVVSIGFGRNEDNVAKDLINDLSDKGYNTSQKEWVEPMTLKAFVKEQIEAGRPVPQDLFGVFTGRKTKIKGK